MIIENWEAFDKSLDTRTLESTGQIDLVSVIFPDNGDEPYQDEKINVYD